MKKFKKFTLKTIQKNLLVICASISVLIGTIKEIISLFVTKATATISGIVPMSTHLSHAHTSLHHSIWYTMKHWAFQHWNIVLMIFGALVIALIIFLVDEIKENKK